MKISGISSARSSSRQPDAPAPDSGTAPARRSFALGGRSATLDPRTHAVRGDLADLRLADRVFAPHYAAPMPVSLTGTVMLRATAALDSEELEQLNAGDIFDVLELAGANAWGQAQASGLVGYVLASAIGERAA